VVQIDVDAVEACTAAFLDVAPAASDNETNICISTLYKIAYLLRNPPNRLMDYEEKVDQHILGWHRQFPRLLCGSFVYPNETVLYAQPFKYWSRAKNTETSLQSWIQRIHPLTDG
jgi:hypothetical protein